MITATNYSLVVLSLLPPILYILLDAIFSIPFAATMLLECNQISKLYKLASMCS